MTVAISVADRAVTDSAVAFARELAAQAARFAAEIERLHARDHADGEACTACQGRGDGEAA